MIFEQIKKYPEPIKTTYTGGSHFQKTEAEKLAWAQECNDALVIAQSFLAVGDTVQLNHRRQYTRVTIHNFLTDPDKIYPYMEKPCFIEATNPIYPQSGPSRYALHELDLSSISYKDAPNANINV